MWNGSCKSVLCNHRSKSILFADNVGVQFVDNLVQYDCKEVQKLIKVLFGIEGSL